MAAHPQEFSPSSIIERGTCRSRAALCPLNFFRARFISERSSAHLLRERNSCRPPVPKLFYGAPYSLYRFRIDTRDNRFEAFDFVDNPATLEVAFRSNNLGIICLFDGGLHQRFRQPWYEFLAGQALHPLQFAEVAARMIYDQTVLDEDAMQVTYYWNKALNAVVSQTHTPRYFNPYFEMHHDPERQAHLIARFTFNDPSQILRPDGRVVTCLQDLKGDFLRFAVTDEELAAARARAKQ